MSDASEQANGRASGPVLTSQFMAVLPHCAQVPFSHHEANKTKSDSKCHKNLLADFFVSLFFVVIFVTSQRLRGVSDKGSCEGDSR